jgi:DNA modification methylase
VAYDDYPSKRNKRSVWTVTAKPYKDAHFATFPPELIEPCIKAGCPEGGTVLDPFMGSGTTLMVACRLGRKSIGIELNPTYIKMAKDRIDKDSRPSTFRTNDDTNSPLFSGLG